MRTLHVATARTWRGGEQQVLYLLQGLTLRGWNPVLATPGKSPLARRATEAGVRVVPIASHGDADPMAAFRLRRLAREGFDLLHLHTGHAHALGLLATAGLRPRPAIVVSRRVDFIPRGPLRRLKYGPGVDRFIAVSDGVARILRAAGVPADRVTTVHSGIDPARMAVPRDPAGLRRELAIPMDAKLVGFIGALVSHKAPQDFLEALARSAAPVHGVLAGAGDLESLLRERAARPDLSGRVHFLGHREDVARLVRSIDVFCLSSRLEGLGTSVLDAMAAGTPVVASAGGGIPEMVEDGVSGLLVRPAAPEALADAIRRVLEEPGLAGRLVEGGLARVRRFTADRMVEGTIAVYEAIQKRSGPTS